MMRSIERNMMASVMSMDHLPTLRRALADYSHALPHPDVPVRHHANGHRIGLAGVGQVPQHELPLQRGHVPRSPIVEVADLLVVENRLPAALAERHVPS